MLFFKQFTLSQRGFIWKKRTVSAFCKCFQLIILLVDNINSFPIILSVSNEMSIIFSQFHSPFQLLRYSKLIILRGSLIPILSSFSVEGWPPTISRDLKEYLQPTFKSKPYLQVNQTISWRGKDYPKTYLVIVVHSSAHNGFERRQIIRQTWAKDEKYLPTQIMFLLGRNAEFQHLIEEEIEAYNDILQADFQDTYANLTLKSMFMLKYGELLPENVVKYVMKVDDDSYINLKRLVSYSEMIEKRCNQNCILGKTFVGVQNN